MSNGWLSLPSLYLSLLLQAQVAAQQAAGPQRAVAPQPYQPPAQATTPGTVVAVSSSGSVGLYPSLEDYMGLNLAHYQVSSCVCVCWGCLTGACILTCTCIPTLCAYSLPPVALACTLAL